MKTSVEQHIQLYNESDDVQVNGGSVWLGGVAGRKFKVAENVEVSIPFWQRWHGIDNHSYMHSNIDVWKEYVELILK
ncbi:MAG: hypothetical protein WD469_03755 [Paenibacillaceae bacterium]